MKNSTKLLSNILYISGTFDIFGGIYFSILVGNGKSIDNPPTHTFYAILIAGFLFCFAILQYQTAYNIRCYLMNVGIITLSRVFYAILFLCFFTFAEDFPKTFLPTAVADAIWAIIYIMVVIFNKELQIRDLFIPKGRDSQL